VTHDSRLNFDGDPGIIKLSKGIFITAQYVQFHQFLLIAKEVVDEFL